MRLINYKIGLAPHFFAKLILLSLLAISAPNAQAYSCEAQFALAQEIIKKAESLVTDTTDARILAMISEAKGIAEAGIVSHRKATEKHTGHTGKYMHGDSVRKGLWAQTLAKEAVFLMTGETN